jgi:hypothetical protein
MAEGYITLAQLAKQTLDGQRKMKEERDGIKDEVMKYFWRLYGARLRETASKGDSSLSILKSHFTAPQRAMLVEGLQAHGFEVAPRTEDFCIYWMKAVEALQIK